MASCMSGLRGLAELSGSFALAGLVAATCKPSRTAHAFYIDPALVVFRDVPYPVTKASGTEFIPGGIKEYPVDALLRSPWSCYTPKAMFWVFAKNAGLQAAFYAQSYIAHIDRLEQEARERALLEGKDEDEADEVQLPPIPVEDVKRLAKSAGRSTVRECTVTHVRRRIEHRLRGRVSDQLLWKGLKDMPRSAVRKGHRLKRPWQVVHRTFYTVQRAFLLGQIAEWIVSTTLDALWLLGVPLLPPAWQVRLGEERPERPPAQIARLEQALPQVFPEVAPDGVPPPVQQQGPQSQENEEPIEENLPALDPIAWGSRFKKVVKKAAGNALRCSASLLACAAGASLATALFPKEPVVMLAANAADFIMAFFLTAPELSDWYEKGLVPWHTLATAALSLGITIFLVDRVGRQTG